MPVSRFRRLADFQGGEGCVGGEAKVRSNASY